MIEPLRDHEREAFVAACRALVGVRFRHRGRDPRVGLDCAGLPAAALLRVGRGIDDLVVYGRDPHRDGLRQMIEANLGPPVADAPRAGDVLLIRWDDGPPRHIAVAIDLPQGLGIVHTCSEFRRVIEHALDTSAGQSGESWRDRIVAVYRP